jgi:hypothetical protein
MESSKDSFVNSLSLLEREVYDFYRENRRRTAPGINDFNLFKKAVSGFFQLMKRYMEESEGGVYIEDFGYFCYIINTHKTNVRGLWINQIPLMHRYKKHYKYLPYFFPSEHLEGYTASSTLKLSPTYTKKKIHFDICESKKQGYLEARRIERGTA